MTRSEFLGAVFVPVLPNQCVNGVSSGVKS
jgi:hypothetical protein